MTRTSGRRRFLAVAVAVAAITAGAWTLRVSAGDAATFKAAYKAGNAARKAAAKVGFEWRDTRRLLRRARRLAKKGKYEEAIELANQAKRQGELALLQAKEQETAWREMVLK